MMKKYFHIHRMYTVHVRNILFIVGGVCSSSSLVFFLAKKEKKLNWRAGSFPPYSDTVFICFCTAVNLFLILLLLAIVI